jgi:hypothetical protein
MILIATDAFNRYKSATGGVANASTGPLKITSSQFSALQTLNFHVNGVRFHVVFLTPGN